MRNPWIDARNGNRVNASLADRLVSDLVFAHAWLVHPDGSPCEDGCDREADPERRGVSRDRGRLDVKG